MLLLSLSFFTTLTDVLNYIRKQKMILKKYAPYIVLLLAALALFYITQHQRGSIVKEKVEVTTDAVTGDVPFSRNPENIIYTKHARCRMDCRHITEEEVKEIIQGGKLNQHKIEEGEKGTTYPLEGRTKADKMMRIVVAPKKNDLVIVTVIDLDKDWPCGDCH